MSATAPPVPPAVAWHDAECGGYGADLAFWSRLAAGSGPDGRGPVLDLGAGTGRVALHLAARGIDVVAVESDAELAAELRARAGGRRASVEVVEEDVRRLDLQRRFPLVIAPMQLVHLLGGRAGRAEAFEAVRRHLAPGGALALTILLEPLPESGTPEPMPDVREIDGWVHSSLPLEVRVTGDSVELVRLRQVVSPGGELSEEVATTRLDRIGAAELERELEAAGLRVTSSEPIAATSDHVASLLVIAGAADG
jgi:SAM-dependent methyltransferase